MSSPLSALPMANRTIPYGFLLVVIGLIAIFASSIFTMLASSSSSLLPNQLSAFATFPGENGKIAFSSTRDGIAEIYVMNADGSEQTRLTNNDAPDYLPSWSPDGTKIAFTKGFGRSAEIYVMNADGSEQTRLTNNGFADHYPDWSPDGTKIAFESDRDAVNNELVEIYVMNADGSEQTRLTNNLGGHDQNPSWSPDGTKIAFASERDSTENEEIYVMNADGSEQTRLTNNPGPDIEPDWSPDGTKIVFANYANGDIEIYVMNADGSEQTQLTSDDGNRADFSPRWSPDGTKIVFGISISLGNGEIYVMNADGSEQTNISNNPASDTSPDWGSTGAPPADTTSPVLTVPEDITAEATSPDGAEVSFEVTAQDDVDGTATLEEDGTTITQDDDGGDITISCEPPSGSEFPIGDTTVQCSATDEAGNEGTASFTVTVNPPSPPPKQVIDELISTIQNLDNVPQSVKTSLTAPLRAASNILNDDNPNNDISACRILDVFIRQVNANERRGTPTEDQADDLRRQAEDIKESLDC